MSGPLDRLTDLQQRVVSAVVLLIIVLPVTWYGGWAFKLLAVIIGAAMLYEWLTMTRSRSDSRTQLIATIAFAVASLALLSNVEPGFTLFLIAAGTALTALSAFLGQSGLWPAGGLAYAGFSAISLAMLRGADSSGLKALLFLFAVVWATDIMAYFVGRRIGGPKLAPSISPGKTRSGAIGGAVFGVLAGTLAAYLGHTGSLASAAVISLILSLVGQAGDLFESWVKRRFGTKDSSRLIPGHGGVLDRVDALVAAAIVLYMLCGILGSFSDPSRTLFPV